MVCEVCEEIIYEMPCSHCRKSAKTVGSTDVKRRVDDGKLAECPLCGSLDIGGAHDTVHCYNCGLQITKEPPLRNAINAWNMRGGSSLDVSL